MDALREDLGDYVDDEERQRPERGGAVRRLDEDPVPGVEDHAVGCDQPEPHRRAQRDQRENAGVVEHEALGGRVDDMADAGQSQEGDDDNRAADHPAVDLRRVFSGHPASGRASALTAAGTAASRCHGVTSSTVAVSNAALVRNSGACPLSRRPTRHLGGPTLSGRITIKTRNDIYPAKSAGSVRFRCAVGHTLRTGPHAASSPLYRDRQCDTWQIANDVATTSENQTCLIKWAHSTAMTVGASEYRRAVGAVWPGGRGGRGNRAVRPSRPPPA